MAKSVFANALEMIGDTPLVELRSLRAPGGARLLAKHEGKNPGGSVKDRICWAMVQAAERDGQLRPGGTIIEPTSGNTGIGLAMVAAVRGYRCLLTMPETMSVERRKVLQAYGAELVLTPGEKGMRGAVEEAERILAETSDGFMPQQFKNPANPEIHYRTTGPEIWRDTHGQIDAFVAGVGTGGTITGAGRFLREHKPDLLLIALEPAESPVLSGGSPGPHRIQGIGAGFVPDVLDTNLYNEVRTVSTEDALATMRQLAEEEGLFVGISSGANVWGAAQLAGAMEPDQTVVTIFADGGEKYLSMI